MEKDNVNLLPPETLSLVVPCSHIKNIHLQTWISPGGLAPTQINCIMISRRHASQITDIRSQEGANSEADNFMIRIK